MLLVCEEIPSTLGQLNLYGLLVVVEDEEERSVLAFAANSIDAWWCFGGGASPRGNSVSSLVWHIPLFSNWSP